jgi:hypothetical protein
MCSFTESLPIMQTEKQLSEELMASLYHGDMKTMEVWVAFCNISNVDYVEKGLPCRTVTKYEYSILFVFHD